MLQVVGITKDFGGLRALHDVSFELNNGEILALIGPNGAGKTTLLNIISGAERASEGRIICDGHDITKYPAHRIAKFGIARTFQLVRLISEMTILENVIVGNHVQASASVLQIVFRRPNFYLEEERMLKTSLMALDFVGLKDYSQSYPSVLSYGQQRMVEIARSIAAAPAILLLDEPAAGLNTGEVEIFKNLIRALSSRKITILLVEHNMRLVNGVSDRVVVLNYGEKIAEGSFDEIRNNETVIRAYLGRAQK